jgi:hypothetical protein
MISVNEKPSSIAAEPKDLCENYISGPECVAPTVLRITIATVPSPSGLGYAVARLRRSGFVAPASAPRLCRDRIVDAGSRSHLRSGDLWFEGCQL